MKHGDLGDLHDFRDLLESLDHESPLEGLRPLPYALLDEWEAEKRRRLARDHWKKGRGTKGCA